MVCSQAYCCGFHFLALLFALGHLTGHTWGGGGGGGGGGGESSMQEYLLKHYCAATCIQFPSK